VSEAESALIESDGPQTPDKLRAIFSAALDKAEKDGRLLVFVAQSGKLRTNSLVILSCEKKWLGQVVGYGIAAARAAGATEESIQAIVTQALEEARP
jgi:hypothetical protein